MSEDVKPEIPPQPEIDARFSAHLRPQQGFTGKALISNDELFVAAQEDRWLLQIQDYIAQDKAYISLLYKEIAAAMKPIRAMRTRINAMKKRIDARRRQYKHFEAILRKRLAMEKGKKLREEIGLT